MGNSHQDDLDSQALLNSARQQCRDTLGAERIKALHQQDWRLDALAVVLVVAVAIINGALLWTQSPGLYTPFGLLVQGWLFQIAGLISHDLFVHRRVGGEWLSRLGSALLTLPRLSLPVGYETAHLAHHRYLGSQRDTENYKQALDTRGKRLLFSTLFGIRMAQSGKRQGVAHYHDVSEKSDAIRLRAASEKRALRIWMLLMIVLTIAAPKAMLFTYWLPLLLVAPLINTLRIIIEHADADTGAGNAWQLGTNYHTGPITRLLFLWDSGDCHLVHHVFPRMPFYRVGRCVDELRALIDQQNPRVRHSLVALVLGWYLKGYGHRMPWPTPVVSLRRTPWQETKPELPLP
jgi:fatty acid desaturase